jgi:4-amino-4-deoxy-L-arabinose transferase-like glycosyltransferase
VNTPESAYRLPVAEHTGETRNEQLQRNVGELLQELRVAQAGVQILFGFLLSVVFTDRFHDASGFEKSLHLSAVALAVAATALLTAPAAWHRLLFRTGSRERILTVGNRLVLVGLVCLALAITSTVALIAKVVYGEVAMIVMAVLCLLIFGILWFVMPIRMHPANGDQPTGPPK